MDGTISDDELEKCAIVYVTWKNPPHSNRQPTETDKHRVRAILAKFLVERQDGIKPCEKKDTPGRHIHINGKVIPECSWHPGEYHWLCSEACN